MNHAREVSDELAAIDYNGFPKCDITLYDERCVVYTEQHQGARGLCIVNTHQIELENGIKRNV